jgi:hypothetical protein
MIDLWGAVSSNLSQGFECVAWGNMLDMQQLILNGSADVWITGISSSPAFASQFALTHPVFVGGLQALTRQPTPCGFYCSIFSKSVIIVLCGAVIAVFIGSHFACHSLSLVLSFARLVIRLC